MGLFKRAAARGIATELVRTGMCSFPSKTAMDEAADAVADAAPPEMPEVAPPEGHKPDDVAMIANQLIQLAQQLMASAGPQGPAGAEDVAKMSAADDYDTLASNVAVECMDKAAAEAKIASGLMHGGDAQNTPEAASSTNEVAELDKKQRPQGKYLEGVGKTTHNTEGGAIGDLSKNPVQPSNSVSGTNSVNKAAAYSAIIQKFAGALIKGGDKGNTPAQAAATNEVAKLDLKQRPAGKYLVGQGNANIDVPNEAHIGREHAATVMPSNTPGGSNSVTQASKMSSDQEMYLDLFNKTAADVGPSLPGQLTQDQKIAAIQRMIPMSRDERQLELNELYKSAGALPEALKAVIEGKKDGDKDEKKDVGEEKKEKKDDDKDSKMPEAKKESSLLAKIKAAAEAAR